MQPVSGMIPYTGVFINSVGLGYDLSQGIKNFGLSWVLKQFIYWRFPQIHAFRCVMAISDIIASTVSYTTTGPTTLIVTGTLVAARSLFM